MKKKIAWLTNLTNVGVLSFLVLKNFSPMCGAIACSISVLAILVADIPEALKLKEVYNDEM